MRKNCSRYKIWKKKNDEKKLRNRVNKYKKYKKKSNVVINNSELLSEYFEIPSIFSIIRNPEEVIMFFNKLINKIENIRMLKKKNKINKDTEIIFKFDMQNVTIITCDALMYLLSLIKNTRGKKWLPINWIGNFPKDERIKYILKNSGFLKYMNTPNINLVKNGENIQIQTGKGFEFDKDGKKEDIRQEIIDFSGLKLNKDKRQMNFLMTMLTELITNISDHAYDNDDNLFEHCWYIFVENREDKIIYTFMDNGLGIPTTIKKGIFEKFFSVLNFDKEYKYIEAGLSGLERRSQTGRIERGNGLPSIYEQYKVNKVNKFVIISNRAFFEDNNSKDLNNSLNGTIFYWEIDKEKCK